MSRENKDIKTLRKTVSNSPVNLGIGAVAANMKRWVTFLKITNETAGPNSLYLCSGTTATDAATGIAKDKQPLGNQYDAFAYPDSPRPDAPLFSIASSAYLTTIASAAGKMQLFLQYYDE